jgi:hypothetical protein
VSGAEGYRIPITADDYFKQQEKRLLSEQRRPQISKAADLLGPGAAPYAVKIFDWSADDAAFTGVFFSSPDDGQVNSPNNDLYWMGETFGTAAGFGFQRLTQIFVSPPGPITPSVQIRHFYSPAGVRVYSPWVAL